MPGPYPMTYSARGLPWALAKWAALLVALHLAVMAIYFLKVIPSDAFKLRWSHVSIFDLDTEEGFGTWFSAVLLLIAGRFLWHEARRVRSAGERWAAWWATLAVGFHFLSLDEVVGLHEYLNHMLKTYGSGMRWTAIGGPLAAAVGLAFLPWLLRLPARTRGIFLIGGTLYLGGAVLVERATDVYEAWGKLNTLEYHLWIALEEGLEMFGVIVFLRGLLEHMARGEASVDVVTHIEA